MKTYIVFALIAVAFSVNASEISEQDKLVKEHIAKCRVTYPMTEEKLTQLKEGKIIDGSENERCFVKCFMEEAGLIKDGKFDKESTIKKFSVRVSKEKAEKAVNDCEKESLSAAEKCEKEMKMHICFHKAGVY